MNDQRSTWGRNCSCSSSCNNARNNTQPWARRNWDGCGCANNTARTGCGCTNNNARTGCGCTNNNARTGCGCANNTARTGCGCEAVRETRREQRNTCPCQNLGTEWRNRGGCNSCAQTRTTHSCAACNQGAEDRGFLNGQSLAMVYSPYQKFEELYDPREGLCSGTIFSGLNKPFCPKRGC